MKDISLRDLLEAGCHFGHKVEKWHPKASDFIYQAREGIHIIDLTKTRQRLKEAAEFVKELGKNGKNFLLVATKRQAKGVVIEAANRGNLPYMTVRWIGGFITNWEEVSKNIDKLKVMRQEKEEGAWEEFPKHEQIKLAKELKKLESIYEGVSALEDRPEAIFIVDVRKEDTAVREAKRRDLPIVAIVDTNCDPYQVDYPIPANDDAVGSIQMIVNYLVSAYLEGQKIGEKGGKVDREEKPEKKEKEGKKAEKMDEAEKVGKKKEKKKGKKAKEKKPKKRGRPRKVKSEKLKV